ncbi:MAG TPA: hypothetical protein O0X39_03335 [Methanocorpusculum sp.]|nr:hypothetical protein [Methanocorpusculum sp.]
MSAKQQPAKNSKNNIKGTVIAIAIDVVLLAVGLVCSNPLKEYCASINDMMPFYVFTGGIIVLMFLATSIIIRITNKQ